MDEHMIDEPQFSQAQLARLADGSLTPRQAAQLRADVERSAELAHALGEQERAMSLLAHTKEAVAPDSLRLQIEGMTQAAAHRRAPRRPRWRLMVPAALAAAAAVAVVIGLTGGRAGAALSLPQTVRLALASPTMAAPRPDPAHPEQLRLAVDGIPFPNWGHTLGSRTDTIGGQRIATVYYSAAPGYRVGYSIVAGSPVPVSGEPGMSQQGVYTLATDGSTRLVTWLRAGHTCVIAGRDISYSTLLRLARQQSA